MDDNHTNETPQEIANKPESTNTDAERILLENLVASEVQNARTKRKKFGIRIIAVVAVLLVLGLASLISRVIPEDYPSYNIVKHKITYTPYSANMTPDTKARWEIVDVLEAYETTDLGGTDIHSKYYYAFGSDGLMGLLVVNSYEMDDFDKLEISIEKPITVYGTIVTVPTDVKDMDEGGEIKEELNKYAIVSYNHSPVFEYEENGKITKWGILREISNTCGSILGIAFALLIIMVFFGLLANLPRIIQKNNKK